MSLRPEIQPALALVQSPGAKAALVLSTVCSHLGLSPPKLEVWSGRRDYYATQAKTIFISTKPRHREYFPVEAATIHELAHHLDNIAGGQEIRKDLRKRGKFYRFHGHRFCTILVALIQAYYGKLEDYPWHCEYKTVKAYGPKKP